MENVIIYKNLKIKDGALFIKDTKLFNMDFKEDAKYHNTQIIDELKNAVKLNSTKKELDSLFKNFEKSELRRHNDINIEIKHNKKSFFFVNFKKAIHFSTQESL